MTDGGRLGSVLSVAAGSVVVSLLGLTLAGRTLRAPPRPAPRRKVMPASLLALAAGGLALWGPTWQAPPPDGVPLRVMSWNLRRLWGGPDDGGDALACAIRGVEAVAPDVLTLLEVSALDVSALSRRLGLSCAHHGYRAGSGPQHGGLATCTRGADWTFTTGGGLRFVDDEDWFYVLGETERAGRRVNVLAVHLYPYEYVTKKLREGVDSLAQGHPEEFVELASAGEEVVKGQADQSAALLERVDKLRDPTVIAGDFNSTADAFLHTALRRRGLTDAFDARGRGFGGTVELFGLPLRVDYVYASPELAVSAAEVPDLGCSDHQPVVTDLVLLPE
jgi:endonuclease/exonuclease/phosphatase (EEP) superfamily protein YafD